LFRLTVVTKLLSRRYQHYQAVDPKIAKQMLRFLPVAWHHINFIGKYGFYNREYNINIQYVIKNIIASFEIDISPLPLRYQGFQRAQDEPFFCLINPFE
jgi:hypothetical protein